MFPPHLIDSYRAYKQTITATNALSVINNYLCHQSFLSLKYRMVIQLVKVHHEVFDYIKLGMRL